MNWFSFALLCGALVPTPIELPKDVHEVQSLRFELPLHVRTPTEVEKVRIHVSVDQGKTWTRSWECKPTAKRVICSAPCDCLYWFALQVVFTNGRVAPADLDHLTPTMKVLVNAEHRKVEKKMP